MQDRHPARDMRVCRRLISIPNSDETPHAKSEADEDCASGYIFHSLEAKATLRQALKVARYTSNVRFESMANPRYSNYCNVIQNSEQKTSNRQNRL